MHHTWAGGLDYRTYWKAIALYAPNAPLMLESLMSAEEYGGGKQWNMHVAELNGMVLGQNDDLIPWYHTLPRP